MKNAVIENRVEKELNEWLVREQRFQKLFSFSVDRNRAFLREKLRYYRTLQAKYKARAGPKEQLTLRMMREEQRAIEKQLYPNLWIRLGYKVLSGIVQGASADREQKRQAAHIQDLKESFRKLGFPEVPLDRQKLRDHQKMMIPVAYEVGENQRMAFELNLEKGDKGQFHLVGYTAYLQREGNTPLTVKQHFEINKENIITAKQAYNLLSGRPVMTGTKENRHWVQLDINDRDSSFNYCIRRFYTGYGFDLEKKLRELPLKELRTPEETRKLIKALQNGEQKEVTFIQGNKQQRIVLEVNPRFKSLNLFNQKGEKVSLPQALKDKVSRKTGLRKGKRLQKGLPGKDRIRVRRK
ncbi:hypothetical protein [Sinomicrobium weinanense]|uniref:Uncharacterized protein n=1 Tax=Sinomicrobium weinanense TaxID=2842200 RepID=A0A926JU54_9FLAO|nr:hypothetical protein [Sinomicrobium weinanense]MBC9797578.1 hypothetical protein [Sinomicrobium weinanense]MBU3123645.1 hypothetical protein [Sinomicrobium weinanense]